MLGSLCFFVETFALFITALHEDHYLKHLRRISESMSCMPEITFFQFLNRTTLTKQFNITRKYRGKTQKQIFSRRPQWKHHSHFWYCSLRWYKTKTFVPRGRYEFCCFYSVVSCPSEMRKETSRMFETGQSRHDFQMKPASLSMK